MKEVSFISSSFITITNKIKGGKELKKLLSEFVLVTIFLLGFGMRFSQTQRPSVEPYSDLKQWLFGDHAPNARFTADWKEKDCNIWGPKDRPLLKDCIHTGIDFSAPADTPVYSVADGKVLKVKYGSDCQDVDCLSLVAIYNKPTNVTFIYLHMRRITVTSNQEVKAGQQIGGVGKRGPATDLHLHFEAREDREGKVVWAAFDAEKTIDPYEAAKKARESIPVESITWREYRLGALSYSIPSDWKVGPQARGGISRMYYTDRGQTSFTVAVTDAIEGIEGLESGQINITHYGSRTSEGEIKELGTTSRGISIWHMGRLVDSFKTKIAGLPVTVCILRLTEREGRQVKGREAMNWSFTLIKGGKSYSFILISTDREFQSTIFKQLTSRIRFGAY